MMANDEELTTTIGLLSIGARQKLKQALQWYQNPRWDGWKGNAHKALCQQKVAKHLLTCYDIKRHTRLALVCKAWSSTVCLRKDRTVPSLADWPFGASPMAPTPIVRWLQPDESAEVVVAKGRMQQSFTLCVAAAKAGPPARMHDWLVRLSIELKFSERLFHEEPNGSWFKTKLEWGGPRVDPKVAKKCAVEKWKDKWETVSLRLSNGVVQVGCDCDGMGKAQALSVTLPSNVGRVAFMVEDRSLQQQVTVPKHTFPPTAFEYGPPEVVGGTIDPPPTLVKATNDADVILPILQRRNENRSAWTEALASNPVPDLDPPVVGLDNKPSEETEHAESHKGKKGGKKKKG